MTYRYGYLFLLATLLFQFAEAHNKVGNGGGGLKLESGIYSLFNVPNVSSEVFPHFEEKEISLNDCGSDLFESLKQDIRLISKILPHEAGVFFAKELCPKGSSRYVDISHTELENYFFLREFNRLKRIYSAATSIPKEKIAIFALSDSSKQKTFIFPEFYKLSFFERKIILLHELFWLYKFKSQQSRKSHFAFHDEKRIYQQMLRLETALAWYLSDSENHKFQAALVKEFIIFNEATE